MISKPVIREIESSIQFNELAPGMYTSNCPGRFNDEYNHSLLQCASLAGDSGFYTAAFLGVMLPYYFHNANNMMVGVLGNLDLAGMFMPDVGKVEPKIAGAREATGSVVDYLRDIAASIPSADCSALNEEAISKSLILLKSACGRSVDSKGLDGIDPNSSFSCTSPSRALAALNGMSAWTVVCLGGSGTITGYSSDTRIGLKWSRLKGSGLPYMPGKDSCSSILASAGGLAISAGASLVVENWTENEGEVSLVFGK